MVNGSKGLMLGWLMVPTPGWFQKTTDVGTIEEDEPSIPAKYPRGLSTTYSL